MSIKKIITRFFVFLGLLLAVGALFSCDQIQESAALNLKRDAKKAVQEVAGKLVWDVSDMQNITNDVVLATTNQNFPDVTISWESSEPDVISSTGKVSRPAYSDPRAYVADGQEETYVEEEGGQQVTKYRNKVVRVVLTASVSGTYTYEDEDGKSVTKDVPSVKKDFEFTVLTLGHDITAGTIAQVKAECWDYIYNVKGVQKGLVSASDVTKEVLVRGIVTAKLLANGATLGFMIHDGSEGIYVYGDNTKVNVGDYVTVTGEVYVYYGSMQVGSNVTITVSEEPFDFQITDANYRTVTPLEFENEQKEPIDSVVGYYGGKLLKVVGFVTAKTAPAGSGKYCVIDASDGVEATWIYYKGYNAEMEETLKALNGKYCELTAVSYDRDSRLNKNEILWTGEYRELAAPDVSDEVKVAKAIGSLALEESYTADFELPSASVGTTTWAVKSGTGIALNGSAATVTQTEELQTVVLTATVTLNAVSQTKDFTVKVPALVVYKYYPTNNPVVGVEYKLGLTQGNLNKDIFFNGNQDGNFLQVSDFYAEAHSVVLEATEGGFHLALNTEAGKKYINAIVSGNYSNSLIQDEATTVWRFNTEYNTLVTTVQTGNMSEPADFYMGSYSKYNRISMSNISYAATSFPTHLFAENEYAVAGEPVVGVSYGLFINQEKTAKLLFFDGKQNGNFLSVVESFKDAAKGLQLEATEGGFHLALTTDAGKKYINAVVSGNYANATIQDTASTVWTYNSEYNTLVTKVQTGNMTEPADFYMGTYGTYNRISMSNISYAATSFPSHLVLPTNIVLEVSDEDKANEVLNGVTLADKVSEDFALPTSDKATLTWNVKSGTGIAIDNSTAKVTRTAEDQTVVLTLVVKVNEAEVSKDFTVVVKKEETDAPVLITAPVAGVDYLLKLTQEGTSKELMFSGIQNGNFLGVTEDLADAVPVQLEATEGGFYVALTIEAGKKYINCVVSGKYANAMIQDEAATVWTFNTDYNTLVTKAQTSSDTEPVDYYMGTYGTYNRISMSNISYAATSYPTHLYTYTAPANPDPVNPDPVTPDPQPTDLSVVATFNLGENGTAAHKDGIEKTTYSEVQGDYTLSITNGSKFYTGAYDATGNSCFKLGTGKAAGSFNLTVADNVKQVVFYVAGYKANAASVSVNGVKTTVSSKSDEGSYTKITVDTSTTKSLTFTTDSSGYRAMINTIEFYA